MELDSKARLSAASAAFRKKTHKRIKLKSDGPFALPSHRILQDAKAKEKARFKGFVKSGNVGKVLPSIPWDAWGSICCLLRGDFVVADLIPAIIDAADSVCPHLRIATLGLSKDNVSLFAKLLDAGKVRKLSILSSSYFAATDRVEAFGKMRVELLLRNAALGSARSHAKLILLPLESGERFCMEGSANCRSSRNVEQMRISNDVDAHDFYAEFIDEMVMDNPVDE